MWTPENKTIDKDVNGKSQHDTCLACCLFFAEERYGSTGSRPFNLKLQPPKSPVGQLPTLRKVCLARRARKTHLQIQTKVEAEEDPWHIVSCSTDSEGACPRPTAKMSCLFLISPRLVTSESQTVELPCEVRMEPLGPCPSPRLVAASWKAKRKKLGAESGIISLAPLPPCYLLAPNTQFTRKVPQNLQSIPRSAHKPKQLAYMLPSPDSRSLQIFEPRPRSLHHYMSGKRDVPDMNENAIHSCTTGPVAGWP